MVQGTCPLQGESVYIYPSLSNCGKRPERRSDPPCRGPDGLSPYHIPKMEDAFAPGYVSKALQFRHGKDKKTS
jgi:hypothetical protein